MAREGCLRTAFAFGVGQLRLVLNVTPESQLMMCIPFPAMKAVVQPGKRKALLVQTGPCVEQEGVAGDLTRGSTRGE